MNKNFDVNYISKLLNTNVSDETPPVPMATLKRMFAIAAEDGNYFRAITVLQNLVMQLGDKWDKELSQLESKLADAS